MAFLAFFDAAKFGIRIHREEDARKYREFVGANVPDRLCHIPCVLQEMIDALDFFTFLDQTEKNHSWLGLRTERPSKSNGPVIFPSTSTNGRPSTRVPCLPGRPGSTITTSQLNK